MFDRLFSRFLSQSPNVKNVYHLSISFFTFFMSYSVAESYQSSSSHPQAGTISLAIIYGTFTVGSLIAAQLIHIIRGVKAGLFLASCLYVFYIAANIEYVEGVLYATSFTLGLGASILWTSQGVYLSLSSLNEDAVNNAAAATGNATLTKFSSIFMSLFHFNSTVGSLIVAGLFAANASSALVFTVMTSVATMGALSLGLLNQPGTWGTRLTYRETKEEMAAPTELLGNSKDNKNIQPPAGAHDGGDVAMTRVHVINKGMESDSEAGEPASPASTDPASPVHVPAIHSDATPPSSRPSSSSSCATAFTHLFSSLALLRNPHFSMLVPLMIFIGLVQSFYSASMPPLITNKSTKFFIIALFRLFSSLTATRVTRLAQRFGRYRLLLLAAALAGSGLIVLSVYKDYILESGDNRAAPDEDPYLYLFIILAALFGIGDGIFLTLMISLLGIILGTHKSQSKAIFSLYRVFQSGSTCAGFIYYNYSSLRVQALIVLGILSTAMVSITIFHRCVYNIGPAKIQDDGNTHKQPGHEGQGPEFIGPEKAVQDESNHRVQAAAS